MHAHDHGPANATRASRLGDVLINLAYTALEGFATDSLALLSDALHNFGDVLGLEPGLGRGGAGAQGPRPNATPMAAPRHLAVAAGERVLVVNRRLGLGGDPAFGAPQDPSVR